MAVHSAGPRLFHSIPFRYIGSSRKGAKGSASVDVHINVVPFVDIMTILVCFLLMVFAASGELISVQRGLTLPNATNKDVLKQAPIIVISRDHITFSGTQMATVQDVEGDTSMEWKIIELYDRLRQENTAFLMPGGGKDQLSELERSYCDNPDPDPAPEKMCLEGLVILQADRDTSAKVLNRVIKTAYAAEYPRIMFAVNMRATRE
jgi:hypothetical protein